MRATACPFLPHDPDRRLSLNESTAPPSLAGHLKTVPRSRRSCLDIRAPRPDGSLDRWSRVASDLARGDHLVDDPVLLGHIRGKDLVPLDVLFDLLLGPTGMPRQDDFHLLAHAQNFVGLDLDI